MNNQNARIYWACRRGMLELDLLLIPFFENKFADLTPVQQQVFVRLLESTDPELYAWLTNKDTPEDQTFCEMITAIRHYAQHRDRS